MPESTLESVRGRAAKINDLLKAGQHQEALEQAYNLKQFIHAQHSDDADLQQELRNVDLAIAELEGAGYQRHAPAPRQTGVIALLATILLVLCMQLFIGPGTRTPRWDYKVEDLADTAFADTLTQRGNEGWELVSLERVFKTQNSAIDHCVYRRQK